MNAQLARQAYSSSTIATTTPRAAEYQVLSQLTTALRVSEQNKINSYPAFIKAVSDNLRFWTIVGTDVASEQNRLPKELKARIFYLFEFTQHYTNKILSGEKDLSITPLIDINKTVMEGLKSNGIE